MGKKTKRQSRKTSATMPRGEMAQGASVQTASVTRGASFMQEREFKPDYSQTIKDLRRIGVLAGTFFGVLIILSFFLR